MTRVRAKYENYRLLEISYEICEEAGAYTFVPLYPEAVFVKYISLVSFTQVQSGDITYTTVPHKGPGLYPA
jgi:hypothetical protein